MKKIEVKEAAAYLPYELLIFWEKCNVKLKFIGICTAKEFENQIFCEFNDNSRTWVDLNTNEFKPILRPLSDLAKEIEVNGERFVPIEVLYPKESQKERVLNFYQIEQQSKIGMKYISFWIIEKLLSWHFDIFGLIESGLAVDINTLKV